MLYLCKKGVLYMSRGDIYRFTNDEIVLIIENGEHLANVLRACGEIVVLESRNISWKAGTSHGCDPSSL